MLQDLSWTLLLRNGLRGRVLRWMGGWGHAANRNGDRAGRRRRVLVIFIGRGTRQLRMGLLLVLLRVLLGRVLWVVLGLLLGNRLLLLLVGLNLYRRRFTWRPIRQTGFPFAHFHRARSDALHGRLGDQVLCWPAGLPCRTAWNCAFRSRKLKAIEIGHFNSSCAGPNLIWERRDTVKQKIVRHFHSPRSRSSFDLRGVRAGASWASTPAIVPDS